MYTDLLYRMPTFVMGLVVVSLAVGCALSLLALVHRFVPLEMRHAHNDVAGFIIAVVGVIYAVLLAFIAVMAWEDYKDAEAVADREANLIGDIYRNAIILPPQETAALRGQMRGYADFVLNREWPAQTHGGMETREDMEMQGWIMLEAAETAIRGFNPTDDRSKIFMAQIVHHLNQLYDARRDRYQVIQSGGIESVVWTILLLGSSITILFSVLFGMHSLKIHMVMTGLLASSIALSLVLIVALNQPFQGDVHVSPDPFERVIRHMNRFDEAPGNRPAGQVSEQDPQK
jgi:hypothetical protein